MPISSRDIDKSFQCKVEEIASADFRRCMQCGQCTGMCPVVEQMDFTPRQIMHLLQFGQFERVSQARSYWTCAACHSCMVNCPRDIDIPQVMEAMRQLVLRDNEDQVHPNKLSPEQLREMPQIAFVSGFRKLTA